jgi:hypothetical protein
VLVIAGRKRKESVGNEGGGGERESAKEKENWHLICTQRRDKLDIFFAVQEKRKKVAR